MSIRTRLTLWYTGLLAVSLLVFGVLLYSALAGILLSSSTTGSPARRRRSSR